MVAERKSGQKMLKMATPTKGRGEHQTGRDVPSPTDYPSLHPELQDTFERTFAKLESGLRYLADR